MKRQKHPNRELVLNAIIKRPDITVAKIASATGLTVNAVRNHISQLASDEVIHSVKLEQGPGSIRTSMLAYRPGKDPAPAKREASAPQQWEVLARFFGHIAEPAAA